MNNYKELIQILLQSGWLTKEQFSQYRKYQNGIVTVLLQKKIVSPEQIKKAQDILQNKTREKYNSSQMQGEFSNLQEDFPKHEFSHLKNEKRDNEVTTHKSLSTNTKENIAQKSHSKNVQEDDELTRYSVKNKLGSGGMGIVYQAYDNKLKRDVALKVLQQEGSNRKVEQFEQEARLMAKLDHPNIVKVFDFGHRANKNYFSMELIQGQDFSNIIDSIDLQQSLIILIKSCLAVDYAHQQGVIHRDLKPANIMVSVDYEPKVMDFGLAREKEQKVSQSMAVEGTPQYMSPEQTTGKIKDVDARSDVYSLGVILYEILTGDVPFKGKGKNNIFVEILSKEARAPSKIKRSISKELEAICLKCLEKDRNMRYRTAKQLAEDIENYLQNRPITAKSATLQQKIWKWSKRNKPLAASMLILFLVLMMFFTWSWYQASARNNELAFISQQEQDIEILRDHLKNCAEYQQRVIKTLSSLEASLANIRSNLLLVKNNMESNNVFVAKDLLKNNTLQSYENGVREIQQDYDNFSEQIIVTKQKIQNLQKKIDQQSIRLEKNRHNKLQGDLQNIYSELDKLSTVIITQLETATSKLFQNLNIEKTVQIQTFQDLENILLALKKSIITTTENFRYSAGADFYEMEKKSNVGNKLSQFSDRYTFHSKTFELVDLASNIVIRKFEEIAQSRIEYASFSAKDTFFAIGNRNGEIEVYNLKKNTVIKKKMPGRISYFRFSPNEKYLFFSVSDDPYLLFTNTMEIHRFEGFESMKCGFFSDDNKYLGLCVGIDASYSSNITPIIEIEHIGTEKQVYAKIESRSYSLTFDHVNKYVYLGDIKTIIVYDLVNKQIYSRLQNAHNAEIYALSVSLDNNYLATHGAEGIIKIRNTINFNNILDCQIDGYVDSPPFVQYKNGIEISCYTENYKTTFTQNPNVKKINVLEVENMAILRDNSTIAYNAYKNRLQFFTHLFISSDKRYLYSYVFPDVSIFDLQTNKLCYQYSHPIYERSISYLDMSFDSRYLLVRQETQIKIIDIYENKILVNKSDEKIFRKISCFYPKTHSYICLEKNSNRLNDNNILELINVSNDQKQVLKLANSSTIRDISLHEESQRLFISTSNSVDIFDMKTKKTIDSRELQDTQKNFISICAVSEDTFAGGTDQGEFIVYSFKDGLQKRIFVHNKIEKIKYDSKDKRFWIFARDRIFIYSLLEKEVQDFFQLLYPITILEGYNILSADINNDFTKLYAMLTSGVFEIDISNIKMSK